MIFDKIFFKVLKIKWVLIKVMGAVGDSPRTPEGGQAGKRWREVVGIMGAVGAVGMVGVLRETQEFSGFLERGWKNRDKKFCQRCSCEAIKTFGKV